MLEFEERQRKEMVARQKTMIRDIATTTTGQSARTLRAINREAYNTPTDSFADNRRDDMYGLAQYAVDAMVTEHNRLYRDRIGILQK